MKECMLNTLSIKLINKWISTGKERLGGNVLRKERYSNDNVQKVGMAIIMYKK